MVDGVDDLAGVDALEVDRGDAEVGMPELALDDRQRNPFVGHLDCVSVPELVRCEASPHAGLGGEATQLASGGGCRPTAASRRTSEDAEQGADREVHAVLGPASHVLPCPVVHPHHPAFAALT